MINFLHNYLPESILFSIGPLAVHWYGFLMVVGGLLGLFLVLKLVKKYSLEKDFFLDLTFYWVIGAVLGARIYYVLYDWEYYKNNLLDTLKIWEGGLAIHGIILGGFITTIIYCKLKKQNFWLIADLLVVGLCSAQIIGRVGNYFNQEIFGKPTDLPWGIPIAEENRPAAYVVYEYFHPTFIYESMGNILITSFLLFLHYRRIKIKKYLAGNIFLIYIMLYSCLRFSLEFLRIDYSPLVFGIRWAQLFSVILFCSAFGFLVYRNKLKVKI